MRLPLLGARQAPALLPLFGILPLAQLPTPGTTVAKIGLEAPAATQFVVRGTVPVPAGVVDAPTPLQNFLDPGLVPLRIADATGAIVPTQMAVVARHASDAEGPSVVELLAKVRRDPTVPAGAPLEFDVVWTGAQSGQVPPQFDLDPDVAALALQPAGLLVRSQDVHGNWYLADLMGTAQPAIGAGGPKQLLRVGPAAVQSKRYSVQTRLPNTAANGQPLPHALGVHAYATVWSGERALSLDLRFSNASSNLDPTTPADDPVGHLYLRQVELLVPSGWVAVDAAPDSARGAPYDTGFGYTAFPLVAPLAGGKLHLFPPKCQLHRRLVLVAEGDEAHGLELARGAGLGFARPGSAPGVGELWSWWNPDTAAYLAQRQRLPELDHLDPVWLALELESQEQDHVSMIETGSTGQFPAITPALGWALPLGPPYGGATSGEGIWFYDGVETAWAGSRAGYRVLEMWHRREMDRSANVLIDADGSPTTLAEWIQQGPNGAYFPVEFYMKVVGVTDPFGWKTAPTHQADLVASLGLQPPYQTDLLAYEPHDLQHLVRATHTAKALIWLGNDMLAKDDLLHQAALAEMTYNALPNSESNGVTTTSMLADGQYVIEHPGVGFAFGRGEAWAVDTVAHAFAVSPKKWRAAHDAWFQTVVDIVEFGQAACSGIVQAQESNKLLDGKYRTRQAYEQAIVEHALQGAWASVLLGRKPVQADRLDDVLEKSHYALVDPLYWSTNPPGPHAQLAVGPLDTTKPLFCTALPSDGASGGVDAYQCWSSFAYAFARTGDPLFLTRAEEMLGGPLLPELEQDALGNVENQAALIALAKALAP